MMIHPLVRFLLGLRYCIIFLLLSVDFSSAKMQGRIVGGKPSAAGAWPFMAAVFRQTAATEEAEHLCGGVIWNEDTILTAGHCLLRSGKPLPAKLFSVLLGQTDISSPVREYTFQASELLIHPAYNAMTSENGSFAQNDVGLIKLERAIDFTGKHPKAGCLCDPLPVSSVNGSACLALGWGLTGVDAFRSKLMEVDLPLVPQDVCSATYSGFYGKVYNSSVNVCAGHLGVGGKDTCNGDSGGPLICQLPDEPSKYSLVGLTSHGSSDCDTKEVPGYYTKVETYLHWIGQASGE